MPDKADVRCIVCDWRGTVSAPAPGCCVWDRCPCCDVEGGLQTAKNEFFPKAADLSKAHGYWRQQRQAWAGRVHRK